VPVNQVAGLRGGSVAARDGAAAVRSRGLGVNGIHCVHPGIFGKVSSIQAESAGRFTVTVSGDFAVDRNYFNVGVNNPPLQALQNGASGSNGVFTYGSSSAFPTGSYQASNCWVDVVFSH